jgi:endonuclease G
MHFFKIIYVPSRNIAIAFMVPNFGIISSNYFEYVTTINEIELITGMDFLSGIANEEEVESMNSTDVWME